MLPGVVLNELSFFSLRTVCAELTTPAHHSASRFGPSAPRMSASMLARPTRRPRFATAVLPAPSSAPSAPHLRRTVFLPHRATPMDCCFQRRAA
eukprot:7232840-Prymnesium_polylepis.4